MSSRVGHSDEMMRNDGDGERWLLPMSNDCRFPFFPILSHFARPPLAGSSSVCLLELVPRPRAWDALADGRFAVEGGNRFACFLSCHAALSLPLVRYCCPTRPAVRFRLPRAVLFASAA